MPASLLFLIGARGTGKTTTARLVAERIGWQWCDADALLEERAGKTIRQIFAEDSEASFRDHESAVLREIAGRESYVVATGGGVVLRPDNCALLRRGSVVWLTAPPEVLWQRMQADASTIARRPDLAEGGLAEVQQVLRTRHPPYVACAHWQVDAAAETPEQVADRIVAWFQSRG
jgi:shikimate kinase